MTHKLWSISSREIQWNVEQVITFLQNMSYIFTNLDLSLTLYTRLLRWYIFSILLHAMEAWTLNETLYKRFDVFDLWIPKDIWNSVNSKIINAEVLYTLNKKKEETEILNTVKRIRDGRREPGRNRISQANNVGQNGSD